MFVKLFVFCDWLVENVNKHFFVLLSLLHYCCKKIKVSPLCILRVRKLCLSPTKGAEDVAMMGVAVMDVVVMGVVVETSLTAQLAGLRLLGTKEHLLF
jgi:hypothetical protein